MATELLGGWHGPSHCFCPNIPQNLHGLRACRLILVLGLEGRDLSGREGLNVFAQALVTRLEEGLDGREIRHLRST